MSAWVLCPGRHTVTGMLSTMVVGPRRAHDAYHRFLRVGVWSMSKLWRMIAEAAVKDFAKGRRTLVLDLDDTLFHKSGRCVDGAGSFRDAVLSTAKRVVYALGLNIVVLTLRVRAPWGGEPLGLPINMRLYRKGGPSHLDLAEEMINEVAGWFPNHRFRLGCDGAYASMAGRGLVRTHVVSRMRRDAAIYKLPPKRKKKRRGRPRKKGKRLSCPEDMARMGSEKFKRRKIDIRGRREWRLIYCRPVLWYAVCPDQQVLLVIVRHPKGSQRDDFFFTTDLKVSGADVASFYQGRWSIEDTFRNVKQFLGGQDPQTWKSKGPERAAALSLWTYTAVWYLYVKKRGTKITWTRLPWYPLKTTPSFVDALACLRRDLWGQRIYCRTDRRSHTRKMSKTIIDLLSRAG